MNAYKILEYLNDRCKYIFDIVQKCGPITKNELINKTKIKLTTLNRDIQVLIDNELIIESAIAESTGGRKPILYDVNPQKFYIIGIDISRTYIEITITNLKIEIVADKIINNPYDIENITKFLPENIKDLLIELSIDRKMVIGIGIGTVGDFNTEYLHDKLIKEFQVPVYIDNGANTAVVGEYFFGSGKGKKNIAYINCGVGIRTGAISSGILIRTINNAEDAFGHMIVDTRGELCSCGNNGCIESYASILKIKQKFIAEVKSQEKVLINKDLEEISYKDILILAESKNYIAVNILLDSAMHFGIGLANYIKLFNPQLIILSGPLIQNSQLFYDTSIKVALEKCHIKNNEVIFNRGGYFKNKSIAVGASVLVIQQLLRLKKIT
ncbi:ROK family protein [Clostridium sp. YIM B02551]|uniref:ROK family protein n=1 Tax=Clostridium sp. YIM B02551 TaxID=2910679 RepID=UPI001EECCA83|nr:ROK family protein [Clostridium sp. YIM B02551]